MPRKSKRARTETKPAATVKQRDFNVGGRNLPFSVECAIFDLFTVHELDSLGFVSRDVRLLVQQYLKVASSLCVPSMSMQDLTSYWVLNQAELCCRQLKNLKINDVLHKRNFWIPCLCNII